MPVVLYGIGGIGKTALAREYVRRYQESYDHILYLPFPATIEELIINDFSIPISNLHYDANNYEKYGFLIEEYQKYIEMMNIITESLYDKPVVVFREYVQNAADSFFKSMNCGIEKDDLFCKVWHEKECLFFLDNGNGIIENQFQDEMRHIAWSV